MTPAYGVLIVGVCAVVIIYINFVADNTQPWSGTDKESVHDVRMLVVGSTLLAVSLTASIGVFVWLEFPRQETAVERLTSYYQDCRQLNEESRDVADDDIGPYNLQFREWLAATSHYMKKNLPDAAYQRFSVMPERGAIFAPSEKGKRLSMVVGWYCENLTAIIENDEWRLENT